MKARTRHWFASLATGPRMALILGAALLPLGIIAIIASISAARTQRANDVLEAQAVLALASQKLNSAITRANVTIRVASSSIAAADPVAAQAICLRTAEQLSDDTGGRISFALYAPGKRLVCNTDRFTPTTLPLLPPSGMLSAVTVEAEAGALRFLLFDSAGSAQGEVVMSAAMLQSLVRPDDPPMPMQLDLIGNGQTVNLYDGYAEGPLVREVSLSTTLMNDRLELRLSAAAAALTTWDVAMILLPLLLWLFAAIIGWFVVDRLLLRPLAAMQKAISTYQPGDTGFEAPAARGPAREIADLGDAFDQVTRTVARHEAELEAGIERQARLVREVHHRVKNNLQVVASLLNIHSRASHSDDVAAAYASIQRRVDALAVVHRNHYAELEHTPGVPLRALISELGAGLRASAPSDVASLQMRMALEPCHASQDVAVAVAFLITEAVEYSMLCGADEVSIALEPVEAGSARLTIESAALRDDNSCADDVRERFERIMTGLARQLRSTPKRDTQAGSFSLLIAVVESTPTPAA